MTKNIEKAMEYIDTYLEPIEQIDLVIQILTSYLNEAWADGDKEEYDALNKIINEIEKTKEMWYKLKEEEKKKMTKYFDRRYKKIEKLIKDGKIKNQNELITFAKKEVIKNYNCLDDYAIIVDDLKLLKLMGEY